ncbi:hypothetical protein DSO57_1004361 [Entomophthora muscae]|uniref:Uncharacterized protein n=1 Tax=Entomophthora muscae TaxID=34485 RepID=A0ACC2U6T2_9FUNG|nr:hypothetical protein DSO57_1004361 [Entomophthora muscae]
MLFDYRLSMFLLSDIHASVADGLKMGLLASGGNPLECNYFLPDGTDWSDSSANWTAVHRRILHSQNKEICSYLNGVRQCYQELSCKLWVEPPKATRYLVKECFYGYCKYEAPISPSAVWAIPIEKINSFTVGNIFTAPAQYFKPCKSEPKALNSRGRYMFTPWYRVIALKIQFKVTFHNGSTLFNQTLYLLIRLGNGQCNFIHGDCLSVSQLFNPLNNNDYIWK